MCMCDPTNSDGLRCPDPASGKLLCERAGEVAHPHDWPYCAGDKPQRAITDTERLDFILSHKASWYPGYYGGTWQKDAKRGTLCYGENRAEVEDATMREAIDAAIRAEAAK